MPELRFTKGHGTGNDFVLVADPDGRFDLEPSAVSRLCDRHLGIGADGLLRAVRVGADPFTATGNSDAAWFMDYRNADGSVAEMCGNGVRVFVAFLLAEGLAELPPGGSLVVATRGGAVPVRRAGDGFEADLGPWRLGSDDVAVGIAGVDVVRPGLAVDVPNPHVVVVLADAAELDGADLTSPPELDPVPLVGANVELVHAADPLVEHGVARIRMRVHERGSGETLSCGTGAVAAAIAVRHWAGPAAPDEWRVAVPGGELGVRVISVQGEQRVLLSGPAALVYRGVVDV